MRQTRRALLTDAGVPMQAPSERPAQTATREDMTRHAPASVRGLLGLALLLASAAAHADKPVLRVGDDPPDVSAKAAWRDKVHLGDYRGRIVVISFFASWCGPCRHEVPMLMSLQKNATREKVVVISVNWQQGPAEFRQIKKIFDDHG